MSISTESASGQAASAEQSVTPLAGSAASAQPTETLQRHIDWTGAFWVASGVPPLVLFSIGAVAAVAGRVSWMIWTASVLIGFVQCFTYAEITGLFPNKSGGASIYGAIAWARYSKWLAPISVWSNWLAWSPAAEREWRGFLTVEALRVLRANGRC